MDNSYVKQGVLSYFSKGFFLKLQKYKDYYVLLVGASVSGLARLELYEVSRPARTNNHVLVLVGSEVIKVVQDDIHTPNEGRGFTVATKKVSHYFLARDVNEATKWVKAIQEAFKFNSHPHQRYPQSPIAEKNDIYKSLEETAAMRKNFLVQLGTDIQARLRVQGSARLLVDQGHISITTPSGQILMRWSIFHLRRYGFTDSDFHLEAGSKSESGPGMFTFMSTQGSTINTIINQEKEQLRSTMLRRKQYPSTTSSKSLPFPRQPHNLPVPLPCTTTRRSHQVSSEPFVPHRLCEDVSTLQVGFTPLSKQSQSFSCPQVSSHPIPSLDSHGGLMRQALPVPSTRSIECINSASAKNNKMSHHDKQSPNTSVKWKDISSKASFTCPASYEPIYDELVKVKNAWKTHGYGSDDFMEIEGSYLSYDDSKYRQPAQHKARGGQQTADKEKVEEMEPIYAQVQWDKKLPRR